MDLGERLAGEEPVFTAWSALPDALTVEAVAATVFDAVTLDMQHGGHGEDSVLRGLAPVIAAGKHALVRIPVGRFDMASRALDYGAEAIIAPMVNSVEDARAFAAACKYPPLGERSWGPSFALARRRDPGVDWLAKANGRALAFAMIETRRAFEALDAILDVDGIDGVFVGPSDFSIAWSGGSAVNPALDDMMEAVARIAERARGAGKHAGLYLADPATAGRYGRMGYRLMAMGSDSRYIAIGVKSLVDTARASLAG